MVDKFKELLKKNGQSLRWFFDTNIKEKTGLTYSGFTSQLNGYSPVSDDVKEELVKYNMTMQ